MTDEKGHEMVNYDVVQFDEVIQAVGPEPLLQLIKEAGGDTTRIWWCPICKQWSLQ